MTAHYDPWADSSETVLLFTALPPVDTLVAEVTGLPQEFHSGGLYHWAEPALGRLIKRVKIAASATPKATTAMISAIIPNNVPPLSPVDPGGPTEPAEPSGPAEPAGPAGPCAPSGPAGPCAPWRPAAPCGPGGPGTATGAGVVMGAGVAMGVITALLAVRLSTSAPPCSQVTVWLASTVPILKVIVVPEPCNTSKGPYRPSLLTTDDPCSTPPTRAITRVPAGGTPPSMLTVPMNTWGGTCCAERVVGNIANTAIATIRPDVINQDILTIPAL